MYLVHVVVLFYLAAIVFVAYAILHDDSGTTPMRKQEVN